MTIKKLLAKVLKGLNKPLVSLPGPKGHNYQVKAEESGLVDLERASPQSSSLSIFQMSWL